MPVSKVVLNDETMIDLTSDTITSDALIDGVTAHDAAGNQITGTLQSPADAVSQHNIDPSAHDGILEPAFTDAQDKTVSFTEASEKANISTGDKISVIMGKIAKWFSSFGSAAWKGVGTGADDVAAGNHTHNEYASSDHTHDEYIPTSEKGVASGVATLNSSGKVTADQASAEVASIGDVSFSITPTANGAGCFTVCTNANAITISLGVMTAGTEIEYYRAGAGAVTFEPGTGVTFECKEPNYGIADQYTSVVVKWRTDSIVVLEGNVG